MLEKTRIEGRAKTQAELDKYSDSDEDWNPEIEHDKSLKERVDDRMKASGESETQTGGAGGTDSAGEGGENQDGVETGDKCSEQPIGTETGGGVGTEDENTSQTVSENRDKGVDAKDDDDDNDSLPDIVESQKEVLVTEGNDEMNTELCENNQQKEESCSVGPSVDDDLMFDWEMGDKGDENEEQDKTSGENTETCGENNKDFDKLDENKENIDPKLNMNTKLTDLEKPLTSHTEQSSPPPGSGKKTTPKSSASKRKKRIAALAGIDLDNVRPSLGGDGADFISLEERVEVPVNPGVARLMERLSKHNQKREKKKVHDTDIRYFMTFVFCVFLYSHIKLKMYSSMENLVFCLFTILLISKTENQELL